MPLRENLIHTPVRGVSPHHPVLRDTTDLLVRMCSLLNTLPRTCGPGFTVPATFRFRRECSQWRQRSGGSRCPATPQDLPAWATAIQRWRCWTTRRARWQPAASFSLHIRAVTACRLSAATRSMPSMNALVRAMAAASPPGSSAIVVGMIIVRGPAWRPSPTRPAERTPP